MPRVVQRGLYTIVFYNDDLEENNKITVKKIFNTDTKKFLDKVLMNNDFDNEEYYKLKEDEKKAIKVLLNKLKRYKGKFNMLYQYEFGDYYIDRMKEIYGIIKAGNDNVEKLKKEFEEVIYKLIDNHLMNYRDKNHEMKKLEKIIEYFS